MMESIEKLREWETSVLVEEGGVTTIGKLCDEIEAEIGRDYMKLHEGWTTEQASEIIGYWPKWDDGKPCMFGDRFTTPNYAFEEDAETFDRLVIYARDHVFKRADGTTYEGEHGGYYEWNYFRPGGDGCEEYRPHHVKSDPLKELLHDACMNATRIRCAQGVGTDISIEVDETELASYAGRIRELMEVD